MYGAGDAQESGRMKPHIKQHSLGGYMVLSSRRGDKVVAFGITLQTAWLNYLDHLKQLRAWGLR